MKSKFPKLTQSILGPSHYFDFQNSLMATRLETHNKLQQIPQFFPNPLCLSHFNEKIKSCIIDYVLDTHG